MVARRQRGYDIAGGLLSAADSFMGALDQGRRRAREDAMLAEQKRRWDMDYALRRQRADAALDAEQRKAYLQEFGRLDAQGRLVAPPPIAQRQMSREAIAAEQAGRPMTGAQAAHDDMRRAQERGRGDPFDAAMDAEYGVLPQFQARAAPQEPEGPLMRTIRDVRERFYKEPAALARKQLPALPPAARAVVAPRIAGLLGNEETVRAFQQATQPGGVVEQLQAKDDTRRVLQEGRKEATRSSIRADIQLRKKAEERAAEAEGAALTAGRGAPAPPPGVRRVRPIVPAQPTQVVTEDVTKRAQATGLVGQDFDAIEALREKAAGQGGVVLPGEFWAGYIAAANQGLVGAGRRFQSVDDFALGMGIDARVARQMVAAIRDDEALRARVAAARGGGTATSTAVP